ncbi:putative ferric-chelate reductase 1 [Haliotis rufescens]|uniref:putative ferric-chelate reductase 1 n=1 Tax=Haliotis rufescens TaxID=6454 RepID=UPI00201E9BD6|nr:putative ferric-chelate reductase 1 [Haliotis rufescens]
MAVHVFLFIVCVLPVMVLGHQDGAGAQACLDLKPRHDTTTANTSPHPYNLTVDTTSIKQGGMVTVTLNTTAANATFKGFLVQARCTKCTTADTAIVPGTFAKYNAADDTKTMDCANVAKNSMTHTSSSVKTSVMFTWKAPSDYDVSQGVQFRATIVQVKATWWTNVLSQEITVTTAAPNSTPQAAPLLALIISVVVSSMLA